MNNQNTQTKAERADIPCDSLLVAEVVDIEHRLPNHHEFICARHCMGGWLTGWWDAKLEAVDHHHVLDKEPWERVELTHWISLDRFPSFDD